MKVTLVALALLLTAGPALANDTSIAGITVEQIKMRELDQEYKLKRKIAEPNFEITISGGEASKLLKILPAINSVAYDGDISSRELGKSIRSLEIAANDSNGVKGKTISISCNDADIVQDKLTMKTKLVKLAKTTCSITITPGVLEEGDRSTFEPVMCSK